MADEEKPIDLDHPPAPPKSPYLRRIGHAMRKGLRGKAAANAAGYKGRRADEGVVASEAKRHPWVRYQIALAEQDFAKTLGAAQHHINVALGIEKPWPHDKDRDVLPLEVAVRLASSREQYQSAGKLAPDQSPPPTTDALIRAIVDTVPKEKFVPLLARVLEKERNGR